MKHIAIYYRVSTERQDLQSQKQAVETWLNLLEDSKKPRKISVFQDEGISGSTDKRPGYQDLLKFAQSGKIDTIVVYRLDRFSRNASDAIKTLLSLDELGVGFISVTQPVLNLGHENPFRRTMLAAFAEIAEIERQTIVTRVKAGLEAAKKRGVKLGPPSKLTEEHKEQVRSLRAQGLSLRAIAKDLGISYGAVHKMVQQL
ncbi:recombinase family protein [Pseudobacteriovorax antillogorgiicola]|uniref:Site-specific DNA recombinase n=1 Tax=Pseudobacteriovorax antillogorgiicola TaxID=1513793 RepID=A0A1Y6BST5_9BACT|nr:recombinase family protein [Pseudobacteriovorax antillogorgiicola]TCS53154.1 DNA invertase Pin-like site-specific DNA recombinase [Pseudobacteriovorax antillogorgiicola]SMF25133.1 Site-specific DNA recombinase [Pseudobacteriovorax antillogorgiicola]